MGSDFIKTINTLIIHDYNDILLSKVDMSFPDSNIKIRGKCGNEINIFNPSYRSQMNRLLINVYSGDIVIKKLIEEPYMVCIRGENPIIEWFFSVYIKDRSNYTFDDSYYFYEFDKVFDHINNKDSMFQSERTKFILDSLNLINR